MLASVSKNPEAWLLVISELRLFYFMKEG